MKLYNSQTRKLEQFKPLQNNTVKLYVCGITPNNATHLGHAFTYVTFDTLVRLLRFKGYNVTFTQNVTDINDDMWDLEKMEKESQQSGKTWKEIADYWNTIYLQTMEQLNVAKPDNYVYATSVMEKIIAMNESLIAKGLAYVADGNVYFDTAKDKEYGKLSYYNKEMMLHLASFSEHDRVDTNRRNPLDFLLWMKRESKPNWQSPWGNGVPGWHIECSAINNEYMGAQIDIHGGGKDLLFPHHESEIAQSENYTDKKPFVKYWLHTAMVLNDGEKMAKSLGNLVVVSDLLKTYSAQAIRWYLLSHHYRNPWEYHEEDLKKSEQAFACIARALAVQTKGTKKLSSGVYAKRFDKQLSNDLDTPSVLSTMQTLAKRIISCKHAYNVTELQNALQEVVQLLGFTI